MKIKLLSLGLAVALIFSNLGQLASYTPSRDYPAIKSMALDFKDGFSLSSNIFFTSSEPMLAEAGGDKVVNLWREYDLWELNRAAKEYAKLNNKNAFDYLSESYVLNSLGHRLLFDMELNRQVSGLDFEAGLVKRNIFDDLPLAICGRHAEFNRKLLQNIDFFCNLSINFMRAMSFGKYAPAESLVARITNSKDPDLSCYPGVSSEVLLSMLEEARRKIQEDVGANNYMVEQAGFTDLVTMLGLRKRLEFCYKCRRIDLYSGLIFTLPSGQRASPDEVLSFNFGYPTMTFGLMGGADVLFKRDFSGGVGLVLNFGHNYESMQHIPLGKEPALLSPYKNMISYDYGRTLTTNLYLLWNNILAERFDFKVSFVMTKHSRDRLFGDTSVHSPIVRNQRGIVPSPVLASTDEVRDTLEQFEKYSAWNTRFWEFKFNYRAGDLLSAEAGKTNIFLACQYPLNSDKVIKHYRFMLGANINF